MSERKRKPIFLLLLVVIVLMAFLGLFAAYLAVSTEVAAQFGIPSENLTTRQRVIYTVELFVNKDKMLSPMAALGEEQLFVIGPGESVSMVCIRLEQMGLIPDAELFRIYLVYSGLDRFLQSGDFSLSPTMSPMQIAADLLDATPTDATVTILAGWRIEEVAASVAASGLPVDAAQFAAAAYAPPPEFFIGLPVTGAPTLEGLLFPGTYVIPREAADQTVVFQTVLAAFAENLDQSLIDGFTRQGLSVYEGVILASIVEKEAVLDEEKPMIASVFYNRLAQGMRLETDPTVQYALGFQVEGQTWWKSPLGSEDLQVVSPYNTYQNPGLPPTPIANPDLSSLQAVAFPAETPYFYFRAACDGSGRHNFAITYEEHLNNGCE